MARKQRIRRKHRVKLGKALNVVETVGEAAARFGGAIPLVGGMVQAAGNALDMGAERARDVKNALAPRRKRKGGKSGKFARKRPEGLEGNGRPEGSEEAGPEVGPPAGAGTDAPRSVGVAVAAAVALAGLAFVASRK